MPSNLLKSSPVDTSPPVIILPPNIVEIEVDGVTEQIDIYSELSVLSKEELDQNDANNAPVGEGDTRYIDQQQNTPCSQYSEVSCSSTTTTTTTGKSGRRGKALNRSHKKMHNSQLDSSKNGETPRSSNSRKSLKQQQPAEDKNLPQALVKILDDYKLSEAPSRPNAAYIRYIERTPEELADIVEYDLDEEDLAWLDLMNKHRSQENFPPITPDWMEQIMDRLEKESCYMSSGLDQGPLIDDDAVCCICMDGECQNANAILFCDMCNLAVHQECYGVPYIPEGQWLCRRCFFSPSRPVECVLCPNSGGAFKQTECKRWAHVVCAIWIPEVCFANTVFLEPIDNINTIPAARWRLTCFICKQKNRGACIQCIKSNCYIAFHVTCAQQAGLCMRMDPDSDRGVKKKAWCPAHAPADFVAEQKKDSSTEHQRLKMVRKMLAEKRCAPPVVLVPTIASEIIAQISSLFKFRKNDSFMKNVMAYWKLKRYSRNGVPLLRRLQITNSASSACKSSRREDAPQGETNSQKYADTLRIRQDLEKGRLLCELTRKREKTKREWIYASCNEWDMRIQPFNYFLNSIINDLVMKDTKCIFTQPVNPEVVPDYLGVIEKPMDLSTMQTKIFDFAYETIDDLLADFQLMISNCLRYNSKGTVFYREALRMQELGEIVFREAKRVYERIGFQCGGLMSKIPPPQYFTQPVIVNDVELAAEIERVLEDETRYSLSYEEHLRVLRDAMDKSLNLSSAISRGKKFNRIKKEIYKVKKKQRLEEEGEESGAKDVSSMDEDEPPSVLGADTAESSEAGDDAGETGARNFNMRRRLRSTDQQSEQSPQPRQKTALPLSSPSSSRLSRRFSKSYESVGSTKTEQVVLVPSSTSVAISAVRSTTVMSRPRGRGRPPKFVNQRGRGRALVRASESKSPLRQSAAVQSAPATLRRGGIRGRPPKLRRLLRRPLRRSARVDNLQKQAQTHQHSASSPEKELASADRQASPSARSVSPAKSSRSSRHVSPILGSPLRSHHPREGTSVQPALGSPVRSNQNVETRRPAREPSPILGSPLKPHQMHMVRRALNRQISPNQKTSPLPRQPSPQLPATGDVARSRGRGRPPRGSAVSVNRTDSGSSKSMEAAAKSIVCEERLLRVARQQQTSTTTKSARRRLVMGKKEEHHDDEREDDIQIIASPARIVRRNSVTKGSALLQNLKAARKASIGNTSPARRLKGPASAVGKRRKSATTDLNGPLNTSSIPRSGEASVPERRKSPIGVQAMNGITAMNPARQQQQMASIQRQLKRRPKRSAAVTAAKSIHGGNNSAHHNNNMVGSGSSHHHHHHHHHHHPHHSPRKMDSFSVYRSGGDHDINSYSEAESLNEDEDEGEEEEIEGEENEEEEDDENNTEDDDEDEEEEGGNVSKALSSSEEDEGEESGGNASAETDEDQDEDSLHASKANTPSSCYQDEESEIEEEADDEEEEEDEEEETSSSSEEEPDVFVADEDPKPTDEDSDNEEDLSQPDDLPSVPPPVQPTEFRQRSPGSDSSGSIISISYVPRTGTSSSSSITTPQHQSPAPTAKRVIRRRRSSKVSILNKPNATASSSASHPLLHRQIAARVNQISAQIVSPVSLNNNNNILCNNKEKDRDNASTSSSSGSSVDHASPLNGSSHHRRHHHHHHHHQQQQH